MQNRFTADYGLACPIVQGTLGMASMPPLVAAVSQAGGMGTLGAIGWSLLSAIELRGLLRAVRDLTDRPFGVAFDSAFATEDHVRACIDMRVPVVSFDTPDPPSRFVGRLRGHDIRVWARAGSVAEARTAVRAGADAVIAHGWEGAGGSRGETGTFTLVPAVVDAVWPVPVLASGGIADGRGLVAALALGADAVWVGTRFLASREANAHAGFKRRIIEAGEGDTGIGTVVSASGSPLPVRVLRRGAVRDPVESGVRVDRNGSSNGERRLIGHTEIGGRSVAIPESSCILPTPEARGEIDSMCMPAGQSAALIPSVRGAGEIVRRIVEEADRVSRGERLPPR